MPEKSVLDRLHPDNPAGGSLALMHIRPPRELRWVALGLGVFIPLLLVVILIVPWQQSALGVGSVIAYAPEERQQAVEAPISGRLVEWFVQEGQAVRKGDPLVEIRDNDPGFMERLLSQQVATEEERRAVNEQIASYERKLVATRASRELQLAELEAGIQGTLQKRVGEAAEAATSRMNLDRTRTLTAEGLASDRDLELATMYADKELAELDALDRQVGAQRKAKDKAYEEANSKIASVEAELQTARTKAADVQRKLIDLEVKLARQSAQTVLAPRDGVILELLGGLGGGQVKAGDPVVMLVPDTDARAVEVYVDGNDMPLIDQGAEARLVFEGWPALQVVGLPGTNTGTFSGRVAFVDATSDEKGKFRVVIVPGEEGAWPVAEKLRQGVRTRGFVMLGRVTLGYELWRQMNGFPPLPSIDKTKSNLPTNKKPRAPSSLQ